MAKSLSVLVASHSSTRLNNIEDVFFDAQGVALTRKLLSEKSVNPFTDSSTMPDVVILDLGPNGESDLAFFSAALSGLSSTALVVIGPSDKPELMRKAMQAGARDYFMSPISEDELIASVMQMGVAAQVASRQNLGTLTVVVNGKGGAGASSMVSSLSAIIANRSKNESVAVVDLDLQFGTLPLYFDLPSRDNLMQALQTSDALDPVALSNLMERHGSGVNILSSQPKEVRLPNSASATSVETMLSMLAMSHDHVIVDVPRNIDDVVTAAFEAADKVIIVTQQSVPHVRDARYLMSLVRSLGVASNRIKILVNRFEKKGDVSLRDISDTFEETDILKIPNDHKRMSFAVNNGIPVSIKWPRSTISKQLTSLANEVWPIES